MSKIHPLLSWRGAISKSDLPSGVRLVAFTLALHMNESGGSAFPTVATICRESGLSENTVRTHLKALRDEGWLTVVAETDGRRGTEYAASVPPDFGSTQELGRGSTQPLGGESPQNLGTRTLQDLSNESLASDKPPRKRDLLFEALCQETDTAWSELTDRSRGPFNAVVRDFKALGVTPDEIHHRAGAYRRKFPNAVLTASALGKHWASLGNGQSTTPATPVRSLEEDRAEFARLMAEDDG